MRSSTPVVHPRQRTGHFLGAPILIENLLHGADEGGHDHAAYSVEGGTLAWSGNVIEVGVFWLQNLRRTLIFSALCGPIRLKFDLSLGQKSIKFFPLIRPQNG